MNQDLNNPPQGGNMSEQPSTMPVGNIQNLVNNYRDNQLTLIDQNLGFEDARSCQFDLPTLKKFISDLEFLAKEQNPNITDSDLGIRFYYAAYPESPEPTVPSEYAFKHTLLLIPTISKDVDGEIKNLDYNPLENGFGPIVPEQEILALAQNHGTLSPPSSSCILSY